MTFVCVLTNKKLIAACPVTTCIYHSKVKQSGCCAGEAESMGLEELGVHKGLDSNVTKIFRLRKQAIENVNNAIVLHEFLEWAINKPAKCRFAEGFVETLAKIGAQSPIFHIPDLNWSLDKLAVVLTEEYWNEFFQEHQGVERKNLPELLGLKQKEFDQLMEKVL